MNAIITAATGYTEADLRIFLRSIEQNCKTAKVFLIVFRQDHKSIEKLRQKYPFVEPIYIRQKVIKKLRRFFVWVAHALKKRDYSQLPLLLQMLGRQPLHIVVERFFIMSNIVQSHRHIFSNVLLTDCRDVVIQKDPFERLENQLVSGLEVKTIASDSLNSYWISSIYGNAIFSAIRDKKIVCAGVTIGTIDAVQHYLDTLCSEMWNHLPQITKLQFGPDQAAHNYLIYQNKIPCHLVTEQSGLIATLNLDHPSDIFKDSVNGCIEINGTCPAILHQYDRYPDLLDFFKHQYY